MKEKERLLLILDFDRFTEEREGRELIASEGKKGRLRESEPGTLPLSILIGTKGKEPVLTLSPHTVKYHKIKQQ